MFWMRNKKINFLVHTLIERLVLIIIFTRSFCVFQITVNQMAEFFKPPQDIQLKQYVNWAIKIINPKSASKKTATTNVVYLSHLLHIFDNIIG